MKNKKNWKENKEEKTMTKMVIRVKEKDQENEEVYSEDDDKKFGDNGNNSGRGEDHERGEGR
jgi:hypothetical protein